MMGRKNWIFAIVMILTFGLAIPAGALIYVPPLGDTGWQSYSYRLLDSLGFTGAAGFVVSNQGDTGFDSWLLLDNLSHAGNSSNRGFELTDYTGYSLGPSSDGTVVTGPVYGIGSGNAYNPVEGSYMSYQGSFNDDTSMFLNAFGSPGTNGSILETAITLNPGDKFTFNWAFITSDTPMGGVGYDFALFYLRDGTSGSIVYSDVLAEVVPIPTTLLLLGSGLLSLAGLGLRKKRVI